MKKIIVDSLIEIPQGSQNKYEIDKRNGRIKLDRPLYSAMLYPGEYGYIENTLALDGDPIDVLVFTSFPTFPGCVICTRIIGMLYMVDNDEEDVKLVGVCNNDPRYAHVETLEDLPPHYLREVRHFFDTYKDLQNKKVETKEWHDADVAKQYLDQAIDRYNKRIYK